MKQVPRGAGFSAGIVRGAVCLAGSVLLAACSPPERTNDSTPPPSPASSPSSVADLSAVPAPSSSPQAAALAAAALVAAATPHPAAGATAAAMRLYPDLAQKSSEFNIAFRELYEDRRKSDPVSLTKADWPLDLARQTAGMLGVAAYTPPPAPGSTPRAESWFEKRLSEDHRPLEGPAYDQHESYFHRYSYWVDSYGYRHYYYYYYGNPSVPYPSPAR
jgi:hypothetical protein